MFRLGAMAAAFLALDAGAAGFGEITLQSRVGEPLRAEVAIVGDDPNLAGACLRLAPLKDSDLPVVTAARLRLVRVGDAYRVIVTGSRAIHDPVFVLALRADCGVELQRDFVLMPQAPVALPEVASGEAHAVAPPRSGNAGSVAAFEGDTLESIATSLAADSPARQRRLLAGLRQANPDLADDTPLAEGTRVLLPPKPRRPEAARPAKPPVRTAAAPPADQERPAPAPHAAPRTPPADTADRLVLGAPPVELRAGEKPTAQKASLPEIEERILKMETTLGLLNQQVDKLNQAMNLATEALALQQQLQMAQALQAPPAQAAAPAVAPPASRAPATPATTTSGQWLELALSALIGGILAAGGAHVLARRRGLNDGDLPPPGRPSAQIPPPPQPQSRPAEAPPAPLAAAAPEIDLLLDSVPGTPLTPPAQTHSVPPSIPDMEVEEDESALHLAEIMLSFGRLRGAADSLASFIAQQAPDRIEAWLMLLNLYRRADMRDEYETLMRRIRDRFNFRVPDWEESETPVSGLKSLEDYEHITRRLTKTWGTQSCRDYLAGLVQDNREGQRAGFPLEVIEEIVFLLHLLDEGYGCQRAKVVPLPRAA
ncbi:MAG: hypothetical protein IPJ99_07395 [Betaproteobacteria bacterium]|nr:hypothetical protein [Betaproteobacteria bacterium]